MSEYNQILASGAEAIIPEATSKEVIQEMPKQSAALQLFKQVPMSTKTVKQRVLSILPVAYWVNGNTGLKKTSTVGWENKWLNAEELAVIIPIPENVLDDTDLDLWGEIKPLLAEAFGAKLDAAILFGEERPASWGLSVLEHADAAGNEIVRGAVVDQDFAEDVNQTMQLVESDGFSVNGFVAKNTVKGTLRGLRNKNGDPIYISSLKDGATINSLYGEDLAFLENGAWDDAEADLLAVNRQKGIIGLRRDITMKRFDSGVVSDDEGQIIYNLMQQDMIAFRAVMRVAWQVANPVTRLNQNASSRSPFGILRPEDYS